MRLSEAEIDQVLGLLQDRIEPVESFIRVFEKSLPKPIYCELRGTHSGFRYGTPDKRHFCLLKLVRATSAINAIIALARFGFTQEIAVLVRTITECTTQIEFVLCDVQEDGSPSPQSERLVADYFADFARADPSDHKKSSVNQATVHRRLGAGQDKLMSTTADSERFKIVESALLYKNISQSFSAYVHCKYPETMDLCGGPGPHFHLRGMPGTPKDLENLRTIETFLDTVALCARSMIIQLKLLELIQSDVALCSWYRDESARWNENNC